MPEVSKFEFPEGYRRIVDIPYEEFIDKAYVDYGDGPVHEVSMERIKSVDEGSIPMVRGRIMNTPPKNTNLFTFTQAIMELDKINRNNRIYSQFTLENMQFVDCCSNNFPFVYMPRQYGRSFQIGTGHFIHAFLSLFPEVIIKRYPIERYLEETKYGPILDPPKITEKFTYNKPMNLSYPEYKMYSEDENGIDGKPSANRKRRSKLVQKWF